MLKISFPFLGGAALFAGALWAGAGLADPPHSRARAQAPIETAFRDWRLACAGPCVIRTVVTAAGGAPLLTLEATATGLGLRTPLPLFLPDGVDLVFGDRPSRSLPWRTCDAEGCVADGPMEPDLLAALQRERSVEITLTLVEGVRVRIPASLLGFSAAWRALEAAPVSP